MASDLSENKAELDVAAALPLTIVRPSRGWAPLDLREFWEFRELLGFLVWRDLKVRYKQTVLGVAWVVLQPFFTMLVFTAVFGKLVHMPSDGVPYALFSLAGLVPWMFFSHGLSQVSNSVVSNQELVRKVYFPRLALPLSAVLSDLVDLALSFAMLLCVMAFFGLAPNPKILLLPLLVALAIVTALGTGLWLAALNVRYRDVRHIVPFLTQIWLFLTPVAYPSSLLGEPWRTLYGLNPMAGVVEGFRWALLGTATAPGPLIAVSATVAALVLLGGIAFFRRTETSFADVI
jgi:lipopolysaccharide transport system permease protein